WVPGHKGVVGNKRDDITAKDAASGKSSPISHLPALLQKILPCSTAAARCTYLVAAKKEAHEKLKKSPQFSKLLGICKKLIASHETDCANIYWCLRLVWLQVKL
ncbi:hypothetical protein K439DRAFT_1364372, partial [Ramaria rubella]